MSLMSVKSVPGCFVMIAPSLIGEPEAFWPLPSPHFEAFAAAAAAAAAAVAAVATRNETNGHHRDTQCREHAGSPPQRCPSHLILLLGMTRGGTPQSPSPVR